MSVPVAPHVIAPGLGAGPGEKGGPVITPFRPAASLAVPVGDLLMIGRPPAKLVKALAVIARDLHPAYEADPDVKPGISKRSCILVSLTVRDFLWKIGFTQAYCVPCGLVVRGFEGEGEFHSAGAVPGAEGQGWPGHVVVIAEGFLIDATLYQMQRPQWPEVPGMIAAPAGCFPAQTLGADITDPEKPGRRVELTWFPIANNSWKTAPDAVRGVRADVVKRLTGAMKGWRA